MLTLKYEKKYPSSMSSHIDTLRLINRIIRRAGVKTAYSSGFNPHMLLFLSPALSVGVESTTEFVTVDTSEENVLVRLNAVCPDGIRFCEEYPVAKNPNFAGIIRWAEYEFGGVDPNRFAELLALPQIIISYVDKDINVSKDIRSDIYSISAREGVLRAIISCGNVNLRADRFIEGCTKLFDISCGTKITKIKMFDSSMNTAEEILRNALTKT